MVKSSDTYNLNLYKYGVPVNLRLKDIHHVCERTYFI